MPPHDSFFHQRQKHTISNLTCGIFRGGICPTWFDSFGAQLCPTAGQVSGVKAGTILKAFMSLMISISLFIIL